MKNNLTFYCIKELEREHLFINTEHRKRFSDLMTCYAEYPFFHKGLCKCMYLSCWDLEHYVILLDILNDMIIGKSQDTKEMEDNGISLENRSEGYDRYLYQLAGAFLNGGEFDLPDGDIEEEGMKIIHHGLKASEVIEHVFSECI